MIKEKKYRLRKGKSIVGYASETRHGLFFKGKELLWFMSKTPKYDNVDEYVGIKDKLKRRVYEFDLVRYKLNKGAEENEAIVLWEKKLKSFVLLDINNYYVTPIFIDEFNIFQHEPVEVTSHLFNHPELMKALKLYLD